MADVTRQTAIALTRFGYGARPDELDAIGAGGTDWIARQIAPDFIPDFDQTDLVTGQEAARIMLQYQADRYRGNRRDADEDSQLAVRDAFREQVQSIFRAELQARLTHGATTPHHFHERLTRFWSNHFTVSARAGQMRLLAGAFEREAIRPHILGRFRDLLRASSFHQGMLVYLDNWQSIGPNSAQGRRRGRGLNENLAREIMELHTVTPASGYSQDDVTEFARALTGWTLGSRRAGTDITGEVLFAERLHEPGKRQIMGRTYAANGSRQAKDILDDLAAHPETAAHVARKLATHFIADTPPEDLVASLTRTFLETDGDLVSLYATLLLHPSAFDPALQKLKTPDELLTSTARLVGLPATFSGNPRRTFEGFAQLPFSAPSPEGWPDTAADWLGPDAINKRIEWANHLSRRAGNLDARELAWQALGPLLSDQTRLSIARAESPAQGLTLLLMSPEFQRR